MIKTGKHLRDVGIERVLEREPDWRARYRDFVFDWFESRIEGERFTGETLRMAAQKAGIGDPAHSNAWGGASAGIIRGWLKDRKIFVVGFRAAADPRAHARRYPEYEKIVARRYLFADDERQLSIELS